MRRRTATVIPLTILVFVSVLFMFPCAEAAVEGDSWETLAPMPSARSGHGVTVVDRQILVFGGGRTLVYDSGGDVWTVRDPPPTKLGKASAVTCEGEVYVIGGGLWVPVSLWCYDPSNDSWEEMTPMPTERSSVVAHAVDGKIYVMAGETTSHPTFRYLRNQTEVYDPATDTWTTRADMPQFEGRSYGKARYLTSTMLDGKIYLFTPYLDNSTRIYNPETDTWSFSTNLPATLRYPTAAATTGVYAPKRIHLLSKDEHFIFDPETETWNTSGSPMPNPRKAAETAVVDDRLYVLGGGTGDGIGNFTLANDNEMYTPPDYIPEYPTWLPVLILMVVLTVVVVLYTRKRER